MSFIEDVDDYEFLLDEGLARDRLYRGMSVIHPCYSTQLIDRAATGICCFVQSGTIDYVALVPTLVFTTQTPLLFLYLTYLPFPILEALTAAAFWSLSYLLRDFLYATAPFIVSSLSSNTIIITSPISNSTHNFLLRQIAISILLILPNILQRVWWVGQR